jgi:hypothetical protein
MGTQPVKGTLLDSVATQILAANDGARGYFGRDQLHVYNTGTVNSMNVAIGAVATTADIYIPPLDCFILKTEGRQPLPADYVSAISTGGTNYVIWSG